MKSLLLFAAVLFLAPLAGAAECVCVKESHPSAEKVKADRREAYEKATAVFVGKVVKLDAYLVTLSVEKRWKGDPKETAILSTGAVRGYDGSPLPEECSYQFHLGEEYLVYAYGPAEKMKADVCATLMIKDAAVEEKGLDQIRQHVMTKPKTSGGSRLPGEASTKSHESTQRNEWAAGAFKKQAHLK